MERGQDGRRGPVQVRGRAFLQRPVGWRFHAGLWEDELAQWLEVRRLVHERPEAWRGNLHVARWPDVPRPVEERAVGWPRRPRRYRWGGGGAGVEHRQADRQRIHPEG